MAALSVCMIVKDESEVLERCLNGACQFADEIIIVDTGSTDDTKDIAFQYTNMVYDFEWINDFSAARNYSFSKASKDYIMWLDADDIIGKNSIEDIKNLKSTLHSDAVMLPYNVGFDEHGNVTLSYYRERILRRSKGFEWKEPVHECIEVSGLIQYADIPIIHGNKTRTPNNRNLDIYLAMEDKNLKFSARSLFYFAGELREHGLNCKAISKYNEFLSRHDGWIEDKISACTGLSEVFLAREQHEDALKILFSSFAYSIPRPEICCRIANVFFSMKDYTKAICWYHQALDAQKPTSGFIYHDYIKFIPYLQLCVCYDRIGERDKAVKYNELAGKIKPKDKAYIYNKKYFGEV